jgi:hypothetical protein
MKMFLQTHPPKINKNYYFQYGQTMDDGFLMLRRRVLRKVGFKTKPAKIAAHNCSEFSNKNGAKKAGDNLIHNCILQLYLTDWPFFTVI